MGRPVQVGRPIVLEAAMAFADMLAADIATFINADEWASTVVYRDPGGTDTSLTAVVYETSSEQQDNEGVATIVEMVSVTFATSDLPQVNLLSSFIIDGEQWAIEHTISRTSLVTSLQLRRHLLHEHTRPGYRRR